MPHLFCYGSLMFAPVWSRVVQGTYDHIPAQLRGFQRRGVQGELYPCLIPGRQADLVEGVLYFHLNAADMKRLDEFEGDLYDRQTVAVTGVDGSQGPHEAEVYVLKACHRAVATQTAWDATWFATEGLAQFLRYDFED